MDKEPRRDERVALVWLVILATLTIGALVLALGQVSYQAVQQGEGRRAATATYAAAFWICHGSHSRELRDSCLAQLNLPAHTSAGANATPQGQRIVAVDVLGAPISGR
jgi:hypothetical protein